MPERKSISVTVVTGEFPLPSETFVMDQITGLLDRGFNVRILAERPRRDFPFPPEYSAYKLSERIDYVTERLSVSRGLGGAITVLKLLAFKGQWRLAAEIIRLSLRWKIKKCAATDTRQLLSYGLTVSRLSRPDMVICHFGNTGDMMIRLRAGLAETWPVATHFHGYDISRIIKVYNPGVYNRLFGVGDLFLPASENFARRLKALGAPTDRVEVMRMGVRPLAGVHRQSRTHKADDDFVFLSVGRLVEKKGQAYAIRAMAVLQKLLPERSIRLVIIGGGPLMDELSALAKDLGVSAQVELRGAQPREAILTALAQEADAFVLPSVTAEDGDMEASPVAISEAMSLGLPVVASTHGGIPEIVEDGQTGLLVAERDVEALAEAMAAMMRTPERAEAMGKAGEVKLRRDLDIDIWNNRLAEVIESRMAPMPQ